MRVEPYSKAKCLSKSFAPLMRESGRCVSRNAVRVGRVCSGLFASGQFMASSSLGRCRRWWPSSAAMKCADNVYYSKEASLNYLPPTKTYITLQGASSEFLVEDGPDVLSLTSELLRDNFHQHMLISKAHFAHAYCATQLSYQWASQSGFPCGFQGLSQTYRVGLIAMPHRYYGAHGPIEAIGEWKVR